MSNPEKTPFMHTCAVTGCEKTVPRKLLMCKSHWQRVPAAIKKEVWAGYKGGSAHWLSARAAAIEALDNISNQEG